MLPGSKSNEMCDKLKKILTHLLVQKFLLMH